MNNDQLVDAVLRAEQLTADGAPAMRPANRFFGVGPITDMSPDEFESRRRRIDFQHWLESNYLKYDDAGNVIGCFTVSEFSRSMHRGYPADKVVLDMMRAIHRYFGFPKHNQIAVGLGGGHSGFTVAALHMVSAHDQSQHIYVDTVAPESETSGACGFFRQSWGTQLTEMLRYAKDGDESRLHFAETEGRVPTAEQLKEMGVKLFLGVGHETTGATTYTEEEVLELLRWIDMNPDEHHAVIDGTSMLGAMPWSDATVDAMVAKCCLFSPFQKAIGGVSGYFIFSMTPQALAWVNHNVSHPSWAIPRQLKVAVAEDAKKPLTGKYSTAFGPIYDAQQDQMLGGIINTFSILAFAETTYGILENEKTIGDVYTLNRRSAHNRQLIDDWAASNDLFTLGVKDSASRGAAVTLLKVTDSDIEDADLHHEIIVLSKQMLGYEGLTDAAGNHEAGLDIARYVNAFPGTDGDYRAWIGGIRPAEDITALLENIKYCYLRAKCFALKKRLGDAQSTAVNEAVARGEDSASTYKVLIIDLIGMRFDNEGEPDYREVKAHIESKGGVFHLGLSDSAGELSAGKVHFFYNPHLSTHDAILAQTDAGQYDALIAAATFIPEASQFRLGGVRIGAGTGNMGAASWGGGNGQGGEAALMNTPSFNSRATAQMVMKALLQVLPDLPEQEMHARVVAEEFDTGKHLVEYPTEKLEGKKIAVIGYGNIGREVAKLAQAFQMQVTVFAREAHRKWIESEGFEYADSLVEAARDKDVISPHLGLGAWDANAERYANAGVIDASVLSVMNQGAVLINYDRGELVDCVALDAALESGQIRFAAIDADIFKDEASGALSGPMQPYLEIYPKHQNKMRLLPHAAADTEHHSRVMGAKQAVDQILSVIHDKCVINGVGDIPEGYRDGKRFTVNGVGRVDRDRIGALSAEEIAKLRHCAEDMSAFWGAIDSTQNTDERAALIDNHAERVMLSSNQLMTLLHKLGLQGPIGS